MSCAGGTSERQVAVLFIDLGKSGAAHGRSVTAGRSGVAAVIAAVAVVGVIANLALFFAWHTFWFDSNTQPAHQIDVFAIVMAICAFIALWKYQVDVLKVIVVCAFVGLITFWL